LLLAARLSTAFMSGWLTARRISVLSFVTMSFGVPAGAKIACQEMTS